MVFSTLKGSNFSAMNFDKTKAMRSAERLLSQGKIRAAITEYKRIVEHDPKDFNTLNMLGDLYAKNAEKKEAVGCYTQVADFYNRQGFSHKAIAVYNKITRIEPNSMEIAAKLAQLYQAKGSLAEARRHYTAIAENHQKRGQKHEALVVWKQIAELDPNNTEIYLKIAEVCRQEDQPDEAAQAFAEAGARFLEQKNFDAALAAFTNALEIKKHYLRALNGLVKAQIGAGFADEAAQTLENILSEQPFNRDILYLLADCYIEMNNPERAERTIVKLVEQEPANYPKFLELVKIYLKNNDLDAAARILSVSSEHLLVGGQAEDFLHWTNEILARNPEQIDALRLLVRYHGWQRDEGEIRKSLERLAEIARLAEAVEDERYALAQLVMIAPQEVGYARRLQEINAALGFENVETAADNNAASEPESAEQDAKNLPELENFAADGISTHNGDGRNGSSQASQADELYGYNEFDFTENAAPFVYERSENFAGNDSSQDTKKFDVYEAAGDAENAFAASDEIKTTDFQIIADADGAPEKSNGATNFADDLKLQKEIESVKFYIEQGYSDLASKSLLALEAEFGNRAEIENLRAQINVSSPQIFTAAAEEEKKENLQSKDISANGTGAKSTAAKVFETLDDLRDEFDIDQSGEDAAYDAADRYETHYQTATAYKEMGLMEESIREFQDALLFVKIDDGTRRFFQCANLLGHCFMEKQMPNLALVWFRRGMETPDLTDAEKHAIYYEIGNAFAAGGDPEKSIEYFERLYAENVDYRDVSRRLDSLRAAQTTANAPAS